MEWYIKITAILARPEIGHAVCSRGSEALAQIYWCLSLNYLACEKLLTFITFKAELAAQSLTEPSLNTSKLHTVDQITYLPTLAMYEARRAALASLVRSSFLWHCTPSSLSMSWFIIIGTYKSLIQSSYDALTSQIHAWVLKWQAFVWQLNLGFPKILADSEDTHGQSKYSRNFWKTCVDSLKLGSSSPSRCHIEGGKWHPFSERVFRL